MSTQTASGGARRDFGSTALIIGLVGLAIAGFGLFNGLGNDDPRPLMSWLIGVSFWMSIGVGLLFLTMIWWVFHARWPVVVRRPVEHYLGAFPIFGLLLLPLVLVPLLNSDNPGILWSWMNPDLVIKDGKTVAEDTLYQSKSPYLNVGFFVLRFAIVLGAFSLISGLLRKWSFDMDRTGDIANVHKSRVLSSFGIFICAASASFFAIDFFKSIEYHWFSTMYGVWFFAASMRAGLSALVIICVVLAAKGSLKGLFNTAHTYSIGCIMLAFTVFWAYISFSQYFLIYNANIPEETFWYNIRETNYDGSLNSWWWVSMCLVFLHFLVPFILLLWYKTKVVIPRLVAVSVWILAFHLLDLYWNIVPGKLYPESGSDYAVRQFSVTLFDVAALVGVGGIVAWSVSRSMKRAEPIPVRDPYIEESLAHCE